MRWLIFWAWAIAPWIYTSSVRSVPLIPFTGNASTFSEVKTLDGPAAVSVPLNPAQRSDVELYAERVSLADYHPGELFLTYIAILQKIWWMPHAEKIDEPRKLTGDIYPRMPDVTFRPIQNPSVEFTTVHAMWGLIEVIDDALISQIASTWQVKDWIISNEYGTNFGQLDFIPAYVRPDDPDSETGSVNAGMTNLTSSNGNSNSRMSNHTSGLSINGSDEYDLHQILVRPVSENTTFFSTMPNQNDESIGQNATASQPVAAPAGQLGASRIHVVIDRKSGGVPWLSVLFRFKILLISTMQLGATDAAKIRFHPGRELVLRGPRDGRYLLSFRLHVLPQGVPETTAGDVVKGLIAALKEVVDQSSYVYSVIHVYKGVWEIFRFSFLQANPPLAQGSVGSATSGETIEEVATS